MHGLSEIDGSNCLHVYLFLFCRHKGSVGIALFCDDNEILEHEIDILLAKGKAQQSDSNEKTRSVSDTAEMVVLQIAIVKIFCAMFSKVGYTRY